MKKLILFLFCLPSVMGFSQKASTWKGNSPGHPTDWHWAANWSTNALPDEFTDVLIPLDNSTSFNYPHIYKVDVEVNSLTMSPGANLVLDQHNIHILDLSKSFFREDQLKRKVRLKGIEEFISDQLLNASR